MFLQSLRLSGRLPPTSLRSGCVPVININCSQANLDSLKEEESVPVAELNMKMNKNTSPQGIYSLIIQAYKLLCVPTVPNISFIVLLDACVIVLDACVIDPHQLVRTQNKSRTTMC